MYDTTTTGNNPGVDDFSIFIIEKGNIPGPGFFNKIDQITLSSLLGGIAFQVNTLILNTICTRPEQSIPNGDLPPHKYGEFR